MEFDTEDQVLVLYLSEEFYLYHLKAYLYGFILSHDSKFFGAPFMVKNWFKVKGNTKVKIIKHYPVIWGINN